MKLSEYLTPDRVAILSGRTKAEALSEMVGLVAAAGPGVDRESLEAAVRHRESLMSTGIGHGLAIPHVRMAGLKRAYMAVGVSREGIADYDSLDGKPVRIIVLIAAPQGQHELYIRLLAQVTENLKDPAPRAAIVAGEDPSRIYELLLGEER
ncbi:MAG TPA: PTS sugar transporter subunit IIA [Phycisphaerae bacterium]|nr:PTS sugar transporter subunit IIA [Phycisphaerae bacterium]